MRRRGGGAHAYEPPTAALLLPPGSPAGAAVSTMALKFNVNVLGLSPAGQTVSFPAPVAP